MAEVARLTSDDSYPGRLRTLPDGVTPDLRFDVPGGRFVFRVAAVIARGDDLLVVANPTDDYFYTVGGAVCFGEDSQDALIREVEEETGVSVAQAQLCAVGESFFPDRGVDYHEVCFYYRVALEPGVEPTARSVTMFGEPESLVWLPRTEFGRGRAVYPPFLPELLDGDGIVHICAPSWRGPKVAD